MDPQDRKLQAETFSEAISQNFAARDAVARAQAATAQLLEDLPVMVRPTLYHPPAAAEPEDWYRPTRAPLAMSEASIARLTNALPYLEELQDTLLAASVVAHDRLQTVRRAYDTFLRDNPDPALADEAIVL